jgi:hypothetical protein
MAKALSGGIRESQSSGNLRNTFEKAGGGLSLEELTMANEKKILAGAPPEDRKYITYI